MKKFLFIALASFLMLVIACNEQPTKTSNYVFDKRNIENDTNWVEFHDYDTLDGICFDVWDVYGGMVINSENEYKDVFERAFNKGYGNYRPYHCLLWSLNDYIKPDINFDNRSMLIFCWHDANVEFTRKIYFNTKQSEYFFLLTVDLVGYGAVGRGFIESLSLPKITNIEKIKFDTILNRNGWR